MHTKLKNLIFSVGSIVFWILLWHIAANSANENLTIKIPLPTQTAKEFLNYIKETEFWQAVTNSLFHILSGFVSAVILGLLCGLLSGNSVIFKTVSSPVSRLIRSVPVAAIIFLAYLWIPSEIMPSFISFLMVFPIVWLQIESALLGIDNKLIEMATVMGMSKTNIIRNIKVPFVLPAFRNSCITGLGFAWKSGVAAEIICNPTGSIGSLLSNAKSNIEYVRVFAIVLTIVILSLILENIIKFFWRENRYDKV